MTVSLCKTSFFKAANNESHLYFDFLICLSLATFITENSYAKQQQQKPLSRVQVFRDSAYRDGREIIKLLSPPRNQRKMYFVLVLTQFLPALVLVLTQVLVLVSVVLTTTLPASNHR